ncbi:MAG: transcription antitermination factor NusB [Pseudomonadota bacterium]
MTGRGPGARQAGPKQARHDIKPGLAARQAASKLLSATVDRKTSLDGLLDPRGGNPAYTGLNQKDQALVRAILMATLRHLAVIDVILGKLLDRPLPSGARPLKNVMRVAAAQIIYLEVPDHTAVDLAVEQASMDPRNRRFAGLVNAVMRRLIREKKRLVTKIEATTRNAPAWFADRIEVVYTDQARQILDAHGVLPALDITVKSDPQYWADTLSGILLPTGTVRTAAADGPITDLPGFIEGQWWVQDAAASIPAQLFGRIDGIRIADLCAAPGGKTAQLAAAGAQVTAVDLSDRRLLRIAENLARLELEATLVQADCRDWRPGTEFDAVLLDPPCSSTGTVRRHPDVPWTKGPADIEKLAALQKDLLTHAISLVRPGGKIVFSTCSLDPREGEDVVDWFLERNPQLVRKAIDRADWPGLETAVTDRGEIRTTPAMLPNSDPGLAGLDGFFAAVLVKSG